jgi:hypothetical protein
MLNLIKPQKGIYKTHNFQEQRIVHKHLKNKIINLMNVRIKKFSQMTKTFLILKIINKFKIQITTKFKKNKFLKKLTGPSLKENYVQNQLILKKTTILSKISKKKILTKMKNCYSQQDLEIKIIIILILPAKILKKLIN